MSIEPGSGGAGRADVAEAVAHVPVNVRTLSRAAAAVVFLPSYAWEILLFIVLAVYGFAFRCRLQLWGSYLSPLPSSTRSASFVAAILNDYRRRERNACWQPHLR